MLAWDLAGKVGQKTLLPSCKVLLIAGKVFIAGEDGAYVHLVKQDKLYEAALHYLKNPATTREFANLGARPEGVRASSGIRQFGNGPGGPRYPRSVTRQQRDAHRLGFHAFTRSESRNGP